MIRKVLPLRFATVYWWGIPKHYRQRQRGKRRVIERSGYRKQCLTFWYWFGLLDICQ